MLVLAGLIKILSESGISAGVRRIEALTGFNAINYYKEKESHLKHASEAAKSSVEDLVKKSKNDMLKVRNLGLKSIEEVIAKLAEYGLSLRSDED